ncbi:Uncharacterised protein, partial [Metamycoplasma alkalescens]
MSYPVTNKFVGKYLLIFSVVCGQPKKTKGARAELNHVSSTSLSWIHPSPGFSIW